MIWTRAIANALGVGTLALAALFALTLVRSRISRNVHMILLFIVINRLIIQFEAILDANHVTKTYPVLFGFGFPFKMLGPALFYFFFRSIVNPKYRWSKADLYHTIPFLTGLGFYWLLGPDSAEQVTAQFLADERYFRTCVWLVFTLPYLWTIHRLMSEARRRLLNSQSDLDHLHLNWLNVILLLAFFATSFSFLDVILGPQIQLWPLDSGLTSIGLFAMIWASLKTSVLFIEEENLEESPSLNLSPVDLQRLKALLDLKLKDESLYLKPALRLSDLAEAMGQKPYLVSFVIREGYQTNFYDLVNRLRINHAKERLSESEDNSKILAVALDSGFNSKSTFNDIFRRSVGMTPSEFRRSKRANSEPN